MSNTKYIYSPLPIQKGQNHIMLYHCLLWRYSSMAYNYLISCKWPKLAVPLLYQRCKKGWKYIEKLGKHFRYTVNSPCLLSPQTAWMLNRTWNRCTIMGGPLKFFDLHSFTYVCEEHEIHVILVFLSHLSLSQLLWWEINLFPLTPTHCMI